MIHKKQPAIFHLDLGLEFRGGQRQVLYLITEQQAQGQDVVLVCPAQAPLAQLARDNEFPLRVLPSRYGLDPRNLRALLRSVQPGTLLHTHEARAASLGAATAWLSRLQNRPLPLVHTRRVSYALGRGWSRWKYAQGHVVCVSHEVQGALRQAGVGQTSVIPSAIRVERYSPRVQGNNGRIGIIGALSPQKGHAQFFHALTHLTPCPEVWIVGTGALEPELRSLAAGLGLATRLVWKGYVDSAEILPHLDLVVVPSAHGEGSSGVIKEGWAAQVPVICSDLPANLELVQDGQNGLVFANGSPAHLAEQIQTLLHGPELAARLTACGTTSLTPFTTQAMCAAYAHVYAQVRCPRQE
ncbi:glycosyltransferase [Desulfovibrionales bacterium]